jgi:hypothetical protein
MAPLRAAERPDGTSCTADGGGAGRGIDIVDMRKFMPLGGDRDDWYRWYNLPNDGHFSDPGAAVCAGAVYKAIAAHPIGSTID